MRRTGFTWVDILLQIRPLEGHVIFVLNAGDVSPRVEN